jgi:hypothetical protein
MKYPDICDEDHTTGEWEHGDADRLADQESFVQCSVVSAEYYRRCLKTIQGLWFLQAAWCNPLLAPQQECLNLMFETDLIRPYG